eukprot:TRINITY_DN1250_c0_g1_i3.p1 TRINITY_DN1250_c0_g1~~TRINITY_DN1250_c0_g1_i3.p1  ORF type:complete len:173 (-),score=44.13 TRINITY_DN1250_c0_g1_i3:77-595(-)
MCIRDRWYQRRVHGENRFCLIEKSVHMKAYVAIAVLFAVVALCSAATASDDCVTILRKINEIKNRRYIKAPSQEEVKRTQQQLDALNAQYKKANCEESVPKKATKCVVSGCSGQLCASEPLMSTCEFRPEYRCLRYSRCGPYSQTSRDGCGWLHTPEYYNCVNRTKGPGLKL